MKGFRGSRNSDLLLVCRNYWLDFLSKEGLFKQVALVYELASLFVVELLFLDFSQFFYSEKFKN